MRKVQLIALAALAGLLCCVQPALATEIFATIGSPSTFVAGSTVGAGTFNTNAVVAAQPAPFNHYIGSNTSANFSATWMFTYSPLAGSDISGADLTIGIVDSPSPTNTDQVANLTLNGTMDLTALLNTEINTVGTGINRYEVDTINIPFADLASLGSGTATFALALEGPGHGVLPPGTTPDLAAGLSFATLHIVAPESIVTPEPSTLTLLGVGLLALATLILRK
jgi:hypothetical protein